MEKDWLEQKYLKERLSMAAIAVLANCSTTSIHNYLKKYNIPTRTISEALLGKVLAPHVKEALLKGAFKANENRKKNGVSIEEKIRLASIRIDRTGMSHSTETKEKMRQSALGRKNSEATKKKMSKTRLTNPDKFSGKNHPLYGKKRLDIVGEKNPNWNGGITPLYKSIRQTIKYKEWRTACFERDNYTCQTCKQKGGTINVDHVKTYANILLEYGISSVEQAENCFELWNISNGRTLCVKCHRKTDTYGRPISKGA